MNKLAHILAVEEHFVAEGAINHDVEGHNRDDNVLEHDQVLDGQILLEVKLKAEEVSSVPVSFLPLEDDAVVLPRCLVVHLDVANSQRQLLVLDCALVREPQVADRCVTKLPSLTVDDAYAEPLDDQFLACEIQVKAMGLLSLVVH